jgi:hypothetical protein
MANGRSEAAEAPGGSTTIGYSNHASNREGVSRATLGLGSVEVGGVMVDAGAGSAAVESGALAGLNRDINISQEAGMEIISAASECGGNVPLPRWLVVTKQCLFYNASGSLPPAGRRCWGR